jgi:hypothetical protein
LDLNRGPNDVIEMYNALIELNQVTRGARSNHRHVTSRIDSFGIEKLERLLRGCNGHDFG